MLKKGGWRAGEQKEKQKKRKIKEKRGTLYLI
jgi:hypothetical protein